MLDPALYDDYNCLFRTAKQVAASESAMLLSSHALFFQQSRAQISLTNNALFFTKRRTRSMNPDHTLESPEDRPFLPHHTRLPRMSTTTTLTALLTLPLSLPFYLWALITSDQTSQDLITQSTTPFPSKSHLPDLNQYNSTCTEPDQLETIQAIEMAIAGAKFRRRGEEQGWSACRMRSERKELRERLLGIIWKGDG